MNDNLKAFFTKAVSFIGMLSFIPIQIFFANDSEVIGAASILFIVCAITFVIPYRMLTFEYWEYEDDTHYKNVVYKDKITKGYVDQSDLHDCVVTVLSESNYAPIADQLVAELVDALLAYSDNAIKKNYIVLSKDVTQAMIDLARKKSISYIQ